MRPITPKKYQFRKKIRLIFFILLAIAISIHFLIQYTHNTYLYKGIAATYLKGKTGPTIYDSTVFANRWAKHDTSPEPWAVHTPLFELNTKEKQTLIDIGTTSFIIIQHDTILSETYFGNHTSSTRSNSFSAAKSFIGLLIGIAIDEGKISGLDAFIKDYLPFSMPNYEKVTIREVMAMSSGLIWNESDVNPFSDNAEAYYSSDLINVMENKSFDTNKTHSFAYKSGNTELLGIILKNATGYSPTEYLEKKVWSKIGTTHDAFWSLDSKNGNEKSFCCLYATARDYAKFGQLMLNQGQWHHHTIIQKSTFNELVQPFQKKAPFYGLQFWIFNHPKYPAYYARGILGQYIIAIPNLDVVLVRTGHQRKDKYTIPKEQENNIAFIQENQYKLNHPMDILDYYAILERILKQKEAL